MRKLSNPFEALPGHFCFGCSAENHQGLCMTFYEDGDEIISTWDPDPHFQGYINIVHGGVQTTLMDEIASWVVFIKLKTGGVTSRLTSRFRRPVLVDEGPLTIRARLKEHSGRIAVIDVKLYNGKKVLCAESSVEYFVLPQEKAASAMNYPGVEAFYE